MQIDPQSLFDKAILDELESIRYLLVLLLAVLVVLAGYIFIFVSRVLNSLETEQVFDRREQFSVNAQDYQDKGEFEELEKFCTVHLTEFPNDSVATWYLGIAQFRLGQLDRALQSMSKCRDLDPVNKEIVDAHIVEIRAQMKGPRKHDT